jgi:hypothetical protein
VAFGPPFLFGGNLKNDNTQRKKPVLRRKRGAWPSKNPAPLLRQPRPVRGQQYFNLSDAEQKGDEADKK